MISKDVHDEDEHGAMHGDWYTKTFYHSYGFTMLGFIILTSFITGKLLITEEINYSKNFLKPKKYF